MKTIKLSIEQAKELYNTNKEFRTTILHEFTDSELGIKPLLRDWEDVFNSFEDVKMYNVSHIKLLSQKHAKSLVAFAKLSLLMDDLGDECNVDWGDENEIKYVLRRISNEVKKDWLRGSFEFLAFKTESIRDAFLEKHERLIKDYFMID